MSKEFLIKAKSDAGFYRCGRHFTKEGVRVDQNDFSADDWQRLEDEPMLQMTKSGADSATLSDEDRQIAIVEAIKTLKADDFQRDGKPKLDDLNTILPKDLGKIKGAERDAAWQVLLGEGFETPNGDDEGTH